MQPGQREGHSLLRVTRSSLSLTTARSVSSPKQRFHIHFTGMAKSICFFLQGALHSRAIAIHSEEMGPGRHRSPPGVLLPLII